MGKDLYSAVVELESSGNPLAESGDGAVGLMQVTQPALIDFNSSVRKGQSPYTLSDMRTPSRNQEVGVWYLGKRVPEMLRAYGLPEDLDHRLWAYNAGIGMVKKGIMPEETRKYIKRVKELMGVK